MNEMFQTAAASPVSIPLCFEKPLAEGKTIFLYNARGTGISGEIPVLTALFEQAGATVVLLDNESKAPARVVGEYLSFIVGHGMPTFTKEELSSMPELIRNAFEKAGKISPKETERILTHFERCKANKQNHCVATMTRKEEEQGTNPVHLPPERFIPTQEILNQILVKQDGSRLFCLKSGSCFSGAATPDITPKYRNELFIAASGADQPAYATELKNNGINSDIEITNLALAIALTNSNTARALDTNKNCCLESKELALSFEAHIKSQEHENARTQAPLIPEGIRLCERSSKIE